MTNHYKSQEMMMMMMMMMMTMMMMMMMMMMIYSKHTLCTDELLCQAAACKNLCHAREACTHAREACRLAPGAPLRTKAGCTKLP